MHHFQYKVGVLHAEDVCLRAIADAVGTPLYVYATATLERHYRVFSEAFDGYDPLVAYALKANSNLAVIRTLQRLGAGVDVVSEGEIRRALAAGVSPDKIVFSGVGKTEAEIAFALDTGIFCFNIESAAELVTVSRIATAKGCVARAALRVNPDVDAKTHAKIATGRSGDKFGVPLRDARALFAEARQLPSLILEGVHVHIGSQITTLEPFRMAFGAVADLVESLRSDGHTISFVNLGGGLGIPYRWDADAPPLPKDYAPLAIAVAKRLAVRLIVEPGRLLVGNAGILVTRVISTKETGGKRFVIVDAGMNDLIRPTLYDAHHDIWPVDEARTLGTLSPADVVGPVCETGDFLAKDRTLPQFLSGDLIAVMTAGAYGAVQASAYNSRLLVPEVLVSGSQYAVTRPRPSYEDMLSGEVMAPWLV